MQFNINPEWRFLFIGTLATEQNTVQIEAFVTPTLVPYLIYESFEFKAL